MSNLHYLQLKKEIKANYLQLMKEHTTFKRSTMAHKWDANNWDAYTTYRIAHIAYSLFKGHSFEQIEHKWNDPLNPLNHYIKSQAFMLYESYMKKLKELESQSVAPLY